MKFISDFLCGLFITGFVALAYCGCSYYEHHEWADAVVFEKDGDETVFETRNGNLWSATGYDDLNVGDEVKITFYDSRTFDYIYDDEIVSVKKR